MIRILVCLVLASSLVHADGTMRVLLADADPELQRAVKATLAPWRLEVIIEAERPTDTTHAQLIGDAQTARFVVWREKGDLVVFDRERGEAEHRVAPSGPLDPASAAAAALTIKTLMRLPPPPPPGQVDVDVADTIEGPTGPTGPSDGVVQPQAPGASGVELRLQGGLATRVARGEQNEFGGRASLAVFVKPTSYALRLGLAAELGTEADVQGGGFKGTWRDWSVMGLASWAFVLAPRWEIEPYVGAGALRSNLDGEEGMTERHERETLVTVRAGTFVRMRVGAFSVGGMLGFDATPGTPTYTRMGMGSKFFEVPPFALSIGLIVAADLGR
ncbi:MAG: hypothetical protein M4D80_10665 [Myxococcota bacterium]|nr:hypothetical protein [Myxococcota bacterium]